MRSETERLIDEQLGARVRELREQREQSQPVLGELLGVGKGQIGKLEKGQSSLTGAQLLLLSRHFDVSLLELFSTVRVPLPGADRRAVGEERGAYHTGSDDSEPAEDELLARWRELPPELQQRLLDLIDAMTKTTGKGYEIR